MFSRDKVTRAEIDEIKATAATRKENIRELSAAVSAGHTEINSNRLQINKNTQLIKMLLANGGIQNILGCFYPDRSDADNPITRELCPPQPQEGAGRKKRKTRKRKGGLPECDMVENPDEWCKQQALSGNIEDNENTMCNLETGKCVKPPALHRHFQSRQGRRTYQRLQARRLQGDLPAGGRKKKRKTRKRRRKKRTKKKTRRKRRKSRKRKTKRRRKKKTRKRKAGCWPFCKPRVLEEEEPLVQQQPQEARTMTPQEREDDNIQRLLDTSSGNRSLHTERRNRRLAANEAAAAAANNPQGEY